MTENSGTPSKKNMKEPGNKSSRDTIDNSWEIIDGDDCDDFVSCSKRAKLPTQSHVVESDDDDEVIDEVIYLD